MIEPKAGYPIDYSKGSAVAGKDRLREMADAATDKLKDVSQSAEEIAGKVAGDATPPTHPFILRKNDVPD